MPLSPEQILAKLKERFGDKVSASRAPGSGHVSLIVDREHLRPTLHFLKEEPSLAFDFLMDVTVVDHLLLELPEIGARFAVVYQLSSLKHNHRLQVKTRVPASDPVAPSVSDLWPSALWGEREAHDMYGVEFDGNPDLRRLLMPEDYPGFPLRKDYPLRGRGERDAFPQFRQGQGPPSRDGRPPAARAAERPGGAS